MSANPQEMPRLIRRVPVEMTDRMFWLMIRQGLLLAVRAIERRHLPHLKKSEIDRIPQDVV